MFPFLLGLLKIFCCILYAAFADGQRELDILVHGDQVIKTDMTTYTICNRNNNYERTLTISCLSFLPVNSTTSLIKNGATLDENVVDSTQTSNSAFVEYTFDQLGHDLTYLEGTYSCHFNFTLHSHSGFPIRYFIERQVHINTNESSQVCASDVGSTGYFGEKVTLVCMDPSYSLYANFFLAGRLLRSKYSLQVNLLESNATFKCVLQINKKDVKACSVDFGVYQFLELGISPKTFPLDSQVIEFHCRSTPPRLLYWELIGHNETIIELYNIDQLLQDGGINVTIKQEAGWSSLRISTSVVGRTDRGIRKVVCYEHGSHTRSVSYATSEPISEYTKPCPCSSPSTTVSTENNAESSTITEITSTDVQRGTTTDDDSFNSRQASTTVRSRCSNEERRVKNKKINYWMIITFGTFAVTSLILIIVCTWCCFCKRRKSRSSDDEAKNNIISPETELLPNPVYLSYDSPLGGCTPCTTVNSGDVAGRGMPS